MNLLVLHIPLVMIWTYFLVQAVVRRRAKWDWFFCGIALAFSLLLTFFDLIG